jgi:hypothetical protein
MLFVKDRASLRVRVDKGARVQAYLSGMAFLALQGDTEDDKNCSLVELSDSSRAFIGIPCKIYADMFANVQARGRVMGGCVKDRAYLTLNSGTIHAEGRSVVCAGGGANVTARDYCHVFAEGYACVVAYDQSVVHADDKVCVVARNNSVVSADGSDVEVIAEDFSLIRRRSWDVVVKKGENFFGHVQECEFVAARDLLVFKFLEEEKLAVLKIPKGTRFQSRHGAKCRAETAEVLSITDVQGNSVSEGVSSYDKEFIYKVGDVVTPCDGYARVLEECAGGIHFFLRPHARGEVRTR